MEIQTESFSDTPLRKKSFSITRHNPVLCFIFILFAFCSLSSNASGNSRQIRLQPVSKKTSPARSLSHSAQQTFLLASPSAVSSSASGKTATLRVITRGNSEWSVVNSNSWITVTPANGRGNQRLQLSVQPNADCRSRSGNISINGHTVNIRQASAIKNYSLSASNAIFSAQAASSSVALNADCSWTVQTDANWLSTIAPASDNGDGNAVIIYSVAANSDATPRTGSIRILDGNSMVRQRLFVTQHGAAPSLYQFSPAKMTVPAEGGNGTVQLIAPEDSAWTIKASKGITNVFPTSGTGSATIQFFVPRNSSCDSRETSLVVLDENAEVKATFAVSEAAGTGSFVVSTNEFIFSAGGASNSVYVTAGKNCEWRVEADANWLTNFSRTSGIGSGSFSFFAAPNPNAARSASLKILDSNSQVRQVIHVTQAGAPPSYSISSSYLIFTANGGNVSVGLSANAAWSANSDVSWISHISPSAGSGDAMIQYSVEPNTTSGSRVGSIRIFDANSVLRQTLRITQGGAVANFQASPANANFASGGGSANFNLTANSSWTVLVDVNWINGISPASGTTNASISYSVSPNTNSTSRSASIRILDSNFVVQKTLLVTQDGAPENYSLASSTNSAGYRWSATLGTTGNDVGKSVAPDREGNIFVAGSVNGFAFLEKYSKTGTLVWSKIFYDNAGSANAVAVDENDNVVVAGTFRSTIDFGGGALVSVGESDLFVAKYSSEGAPLWSKRIGGHEGDDSANGIAIDSQGNVVLTGAIVGTVDLGGVTTFATGPFENDIVIAKLSAETGSVLWARRFASTSDDNGLNVAVGSQDEIVFTGNFSGAINFGGGVLTSSQHDVFVAKFSSEGAHVWSKKFGGELDDSGNGVSMDANGNIILAGSFAGEINFGGGALSSANANYNDVFLAKFSADGSLLWSKNFGGNLYDNGSAVAVDKSGNIALIGSFSETIDLGGGALSSVGGFDIFLAKYSPEGAHLWSKTFGANVGIDEGCGVAVDAENNVIGAGQFFSAVDFGGGSQTSSGNADMFMISLAP